ncbi:methionine-synthesizing 5-methyltetrahydropteroyltriglutamate--homocysteine methyltransferase [Nothophoma quercina]|uniref:Methionine-synthesizing 5-methyltetrahydropteroyltriglutamate--homocysteine methyltransferase n=1 Tax=Nothophoma quercina TaxID=749835 RepID=A0ABR3R818_9PLEO
MEDLVKEASRLRLEHWKIQKDAGVEIIPSNDFAFYDHLLDHIQLFNVRQQSSFMTKTQLT